MWNNVINAWWPLVFYPATDAPKFHKGMITMICVCAATLGVTWLVWYLERREWRLHGKPGSKAQASDDDKFPREESQEANKTPTEIQKA